MNNFPLRHQQLTRYITPLREGGSLPLLAEADDGFSYVAKLRGSGHGPKVLVAELIGGEVARAAGLKVPELITLDLSEEFGRTEPDEEVQDLLKSSTGLNLGMHFLEGALTLDPYVNPVSPELASDIVWVDSFLTNVDRTVRNTNMLVWHGNETWLIDHGASLFFHHSMTDPDKAAQSPFAYIKDHALLHKASKLEQSAEKLTQLITPEKLREIVDAVPAEWLVRDDIDISQDEMREIYYNFLTSRLKASPIFTKTAIDARNAII